MANNNRQAAVGFIFFTLVIDIVGLGIIIPVVPALIKGLIHTEDISKVSLYGGWLTFLYASMQFLFSPLIGSLSDRYGRRPVLLFSMLGFGLDYLFLAFAPSIFWLFVGRTISGITGASITTASAYIADISDVVVVAASGTTGAGRSAKINLIASEVMGSLTSYKFGGVHQHTPEIEEALTRATGTAAKISFTPILAPMPRGILATITMKVNSAITTEQAHNIYADAYKDEEFVKVLPLGQMPQTSSVLGSNYVAMQVAVDQHTNRLVVSVAIDNLVKGAAGQAIQNANIICGLPENLGLTGMGLGV